MTALLSSQFRVVKYCGCLVGLVGLVGEACFKLILYELLRRQYCKVKTDNVQVSRNN